MCQIHELKKTLESQRKELNDCRAEITSLKMHMEGALSGKNVSSTDSAIMHFLPEHHSEDVEQVQNEVELLQDKQDPIESMKKEEGPQGAVDDASEPNVNDNASSTFSSSMDTEMMRKEDSDDAIIKSEKEPEQPLHPSAAESGFVGKDEHFCKHNEESSPETGGSGNLKTEPNTEKMVNYCSFGNILRWWFMKSKLHQINIQNPLFLSGSRND